MREYVDGPRRLVARVHENGSVSFEGDGHVSAFVLRQLADEASAPAPAGDLPDAWLNIYPRELFGPQSTTPVLVAWASEDAARRNLGDGGTTSRYVAHARAVAEARGIVDDALAAHESDRRELAMAQTALADVSLELRPAGEPVVRSLPTLARTLVSERETALRELSNVRASLKEAIAQRDATEHQAAQLVRERDEARSAERNALEFSEIVKGERDAATQAQAQLVEARLTNDRHCTERDEARRQVVEITETLGEAVRQRDALAAAAGQRAGLIDFDAIGFVPVEHGTIAGKWGVLMVGRDRQTKELVKLCVCSPSSALDTAANLVATAYDVAENMPAEREAFASGLIDLADALVDLGDVEHVDPKAPTERPGPSGREILGGLLIAGVLAAVLGLGGAKEGAGELRDALEALHKPARDPNGRPVCSASLAWAGNDGINRTRVCMLLEGHDKGATPTRHAAADGTRWGDGPLTDRPPVVETRSPNAQPGRNGTASAE